MPVCQYERVRRTTITLPDDLARALAREAKRRETSASEVVRAALVAHLGLGAPRRELPFANLFSSGDSSDVASRMEEILDEQWVHDLRRDMDP